MRFIFCNELRKLTIMTSVLKSVLPEDIVNVIKLYTGEAEWRNDKYINIRRIPKSDPRFTMLKKRPLIKQVHCDCFQNPIRGCVWFKAPTGRFMVLTVREGYVRYGTGQRYGIYSELDYKAQKNILIIH